MEENLQYSRLVYTQLSYSVYALSTLLVFFFVVVVVVGRVRNKSTEKIWGSSWDSNSRPCEY